MSAHFLLDTYYQVAYHGVPERAYEVFVTALKAHYLEKGLVIPELEDQNPAGGWFIMYIQQICNYVMILCLSDVIMDILGNSTMRQIITEYYQSSDEPKMVRRAIVAATTEDGSSSTMKTMRQQFHYALYGARRYATLIRVKCMIVFIVWLILF